MRDRRLAARDDQSIEIDELVALALVIPGDLGAQREHVIDACRAKIAHRTADMNPRTQNCVLHQRPVQRAQQIAGVNDTIARIDRIGLADVSQVIRRTLAERVRRNTEPFALNV